MLPPSICLKRRRRIEVRADLPGIKPEEIDIQLKDGVLTISGERTEEQEDKGKTFHRVERRTGELLALDQPARRS